MCSIFNFNQKQVRPENVQAGKWFTGLKVEKGTSLNKTIKFWRKKMKENVFSFMYTFCFSVLNADMQLGVVLLTQKYMNNISPPTAAFYKAI